MQAKVGTACIMSTNTTDQHLVSGLAERCPKERIVPAFGHHPWFTHWISTEEEPTKEEHYRSLFPDPPLLDESDDCSVSELDLILPSLPEPVPLRKILDELSAALQRFPHAILGEVGVDKSFRLPFPPESYATLDRLERKAGKQKEDTSAHDEPGCCSSSAPLPKRRLSRLQTPLSHQLHILRAQIAVAVQHRRPISFHSVRAAGCTTDFLLDLCTSLHPGGWDDVPSFRDVNLDLHSCTISAQGIVQVQKRHANVYVSFSTTINSRQKGLKEQVEATDPKRLLSESDWHSAEGLSERVSDIIKLFAESKSVLDHLKLQSDAGEEEKLRAVIAMIRRNWRRFLIGGQEESSDEE